ncbi:MAG TPA: hypothetical protein VFT59_00430 [Candidatus Saccharimonadales bacterium]|nr:hypothetical protein [Candidatus Saccharimonadales bacterium]
MEHYRTNIPELEANFDQYVGWVEAGEGSRVLEVEGDNGERVFMVSPRLVDWMEARIAYLSQE